jgi:short-subunit dehydrogenase
MTGQHALHNQAILVTGASSGIGKAIAETCARHGAKVMLAARNTDALSTLTAALQKENLTAAFHRTDVTNELEIQSVVSKTVDTFGKLDALVCAAGVGHLAAVTDITLADVEAMMRVNLYGAMLSAKHAVMEMKKQTSGTILMIGSLASRVPSPMRSAYVASKFALRGFSESLFLEVRPHNIRVISLYPGTTDTNFFAVSQQSAPKPEKLLAPQDVADAALAALALPAHATVTDIYMRRTNDGFTGERE